MIGIIVAMEKEMQALPIEAPVTECIGNISFTRGIIAGQAVVAAICGIGKVCAAMCAQTMLLHYAPTLLINCGVAGSLSPDLHVLDIAVGSACVQYDVDTTALGDPVGLISSINRVEIPCDTRLSELMLQTAPSLGLSAKIGLIATGDRFCGSQAEKDAILSNFPAIACEMEGGAVAQVCYSHNVPCCILRAISDGADGDASLSYDAFADIAAQNAGRLLYAFLKNLS